MKIIHEHQLISCCWFLGPAVEYGVEKAGDEGGDDIQNKAVFAQDVDGGERV